MIIKEYIRPSNLEEAYKIIENKKNAVIIGGGAYARLTFKEIETAVDLSNLNLDFINESEEFIEIGAMTTLRKIETSQILKNNFCGVLCNAASEIMGVQMRNIATAGGTVYGKYGFSDFNTALMALDTYIEFYKNGRKSLSEYILGKEKINDIVTKIIICKDNRKAAFKSIRLTSTDFAILNTAVSRKNDEFNIVVGARPGAAVQAVKAMKLMNECKIDEEAAAKAGEEAAEELKFGSNLRGSAEYRKEVCKALVKRAIMEVI